MTLPYPPPFMDLATLAAHICLSERAVEEWVKDGRLPPPKTNKGKRLWRWKEVEDRLAGDLNLAHDADQATRIREATRHALETAAARAGKDRVR